MEKIRVIELFAGIGAFRKALINLNIKHEVIGISEIDRYSTKSYMALYGNTKNFGDIKKIKKLESCDLLTYGFPCQDLSIAGRGEGIKEGTRSGLLLEVERLLYQKSIDKSLPKFLIMENVKALISKRHIKDFEKWLVKLEHLGYKNFYKVVNSIDYGIPHIRSRIFCISVLDKKYNFTFPKQKELKILLSDILEKKWLKNIT